MAFTGAGSMLGGGAPTQEDPSTTDRIARALRLFGAGIRGGLDEALLAEEQEAEILRRRAAEERRQIALAAVSDARNLLQFAERNDTASARTLLQNRADTIRQQGRDPSDTVRALQKIDAQGLQSIVPDANAILTEARTFGLVQGQDGRRVVGNPVAVRLDNGEDALLRQFTDGTQEIVTVDGQRVSPSRVAQAQERIDQRSPEGQRATTLSRQAADQAITALNDTFETARNAANVVQTAERQLQLIDEGIRTGSLANARNAAARAIQTFLGLEDEQIANTDEFLARSGLAVAGQIQAFGAGTGLSDADREFARQIVGGTVDLDEAALRRLVSAVLDVNTRTVQDFNERRQGVIRQAPQGTEDLLPSAIPGSRFQPGSEDSIDDLLDRFAPR